jgi:cysteine-rich repeat protein
VTHLESKPTNNLFFSIKAVNSDSNGVIPFVVRTHWGYTRWAKITFYFLAEASDLVQAGYYQVDTATLSACISGKQIVAFIPTACKSTQWQALTFLNGFEISSLSSKGTFLTPYEVQVVLKSVSTQGLTLLIQTTSATQIHALFVSFVAYDPSIKDLSARAVLYDKYVGTTSYQTTASMPTSTQLIFWGVSSFIIGNTGASFGLSIQGNSQGQLVQTAGQFYYLGYGVFMLNGGKCGQCVGRPIYYQGQCVATCPPQTYANGSTCVACAPGQAWNGTACVTPALTPSPNNTVTISCPQGTYWDQMQLRCLPCPSGCASCPDCYSCSSCSLGFFLQAGSPLCQEVCGDGKKFTLPCDDGNTLSGDGCSSSCQVEAGYVCAGGSPQSRDTCQKGLPSVLTIDSTGQSHVWGKVVINIKLNYVPQALIDSAADCKNQCNDVIAASIVSGDSSAISIIAQYIANTRYSFSVVVDFAKEPIGMFSLKVGLKASIAAKYYAGMDTSKTVTVNVNPAYFSQLSDSQTLV